MKLIKELIVLVELGIKGLKELEVNILLMIEVLLY
jgi:hypothetical protein